MLQRGAKHRTTQEVWTKALLDGGLTSKDDKGAAMKAHLAVTSLGERSCLNGPKIMYLHVASCVKEQVKRQVKSSYTLA
jgi:hypothetical protein